MNKSDTQGDMTYDQALEKLNNITLALEADGMGVDELVAKVNEARQLVIFCKNKLKNIEQALADSENL